MPNDDKPLRPIVYRRCVSGDGEFLVFATSARAEFVDRCQRAVNESLTWGEFRRAVGAEEAERIDTEAFDENDEPRPADTAPFDFEQIPGFSDGDWPPWLATEMDRVLPARVLERFAECCESVLNGPFWRIPAHLEPAVLKALEIEGVSVARRDDLCFH